MIQVLFLDLGDTLVHENTVLPHVVEALTAMSSFETAAAEPLVLALVSDFKMPTPPATADKIDALFQQYLSLLDGFGLRSFFEPVSRHVTLSTHAGALKPARRVFETAMQRLSRPVDLATCIFITENIDHVTAVQAMAMKALLFSAEGVPEADFDDWSTAPLLVAPLIASDNLHNLKRALRLYLAIHHRMDVVSLMRAPDGVTLDAQVRCAYPITAPGLGELNGVYVQLPLAATLQLSDNGLIRSLALEQPSDEQIAEVSLFVQTLAANRRISMTPGETVPGATHQVETDASGAKILKRKRFSTL